MKTEYKPPGEKATATGWYAVVQVRVFMLMHRGVVKDAPQIWGRQNIRTIS
jgi:hypothetical protein